MAGEDNGGVRKRTETVASEGGSAKGECIEPREIPEGVIFFSESTSPTT